MKVFLSSTYLDLIEHRKAVVQALHTMDEEVGHMEVFGARDDEATTVSLEELDKCDVLVGVYAYRYGTVPIGSKTSVTEQEYLHAMSKKIPVLVFVVDESYPWTPKSMDKSLTKINKFKSRAAKEHTPDYFTSSDNLATKVVASIGKHIKSSFGASPESRSSETEKMTSVRWGERNLDAVGYFISLCDEIEKGDEDRLILTFKSWNLVGPTKDGLNFSVDGALLFGPTDRLPVGLHTDVLIEDNRFTPGKLKVINGKCLAAIIKELNEYLSEFWQDAWEDPLERDKLGRPKKVTKYPQTALIEAMVNFVVHRDYSTDDLALISIKNDYIEFMNPGISPYSADELLSTNKPLHPKYQRNNLIIKSISRTRLNQRQGGGIIRIREALMENGNYISGEKVSLEIENIIEQNRFLLRIYQRPQAPIVDNVSLVKPPPSKKPVGSTLPSQPYFVGRSQELNEIEKAIAKNSRSWGIVIEGTGGIGKTSLALQAAHLASNALFDRKIYISAKASELTSEGKKPLKGYSHNSYSSILDQLAIELGEEKLSNFQSENRGDQLRLALAGRRTLLILDSFEALSKDDRSDLFQFLNRLPEGNKAIVTTRNRIDVDARVVHLDRPTTDDAMQMMDELAKNNPRLAREDKKARRRLYEIASGNPLLIKWITSQLGREGSQMRTIDDAIKYIEHAPKYNDPLVYIFGDLLETFTERETRVLAALTHFTSPAKSKQIAEITGLSDKITGFILEDLNDRSIIDSSNDEDYYLPPLVANFIRSNRPEIVNQLNSRVVQVLETSLNQNNKNKRRKRKR